MAEGAAAWARLSEKLDERARLDAEIVELTDEVRRSGVLEHIEGMPFERVLGVAHKLTAAERRMLLDATTTL